MPEKIKGKQKDEKTFTFQFITTGIQNENPTKLKCYTLLICPCTLHVHPITIVLDPFSASHNAGVWRSGGILTFDNKLSDSLASYAGLFTPEEETPIGQEA